MSCVATWGLPAPGVGRALRMLGLAAAVASLGAACVAPWTARAAEEEAGAAEIAGDPAASRVRHWAEEWPRTDFSRRAIDLTEVFSGGVPRDGIPALDSPAMIPAAEATIPGVEPVLTVEVDGAPPRAWPLRYLMWHEIVNDPSGPRPLVVTWCPLCNSALVFDARHEGRALSFGVTGKLRRSDMIMFDRETESWWQQIEGRGVAGALSGAVLEVVPSWIESLDGFRARNSDGLVMAEPADWARPYGTNPYAWYDTQPAPFLYRGALPPQGVPALARVLRVGERAWPLTRLAALGTLEEAGLRLVWTPGMVSALDRETIAEGREIGSVRAFDAATGKPVAAEVIFAFAFHAFHPDGTWMLEGG